MSIVSEVLRYSTAAALGMVTGVYFDSTPVFSLLVWAVVAFVAALTLDWRASK